jgi:hypothetical protein
MMGVLQCGDNIIFVATGKVFTLVTTPIRVVVNDERYG